MYLSICLGAPPSLHPSIPPSLHPSIPPSLPPSLPPSIHPSICLCFSSLFMFAGVHGHSHWMASMPSHPQVSNVVPALSLNSGRPRCMPSPTQGAVQNTSDIDSSLKPRLPAQMITIRDRSSFEHSFPANPCPKPFNQDAGSSVQRGLVLRLRQIFRAL